MLLLSSEPVSRANLLRVARHHADTLLMAALWVICLLLCFLTWAQWANVSIDVGREMYVPAELNRGRTLFRDVMYPYGPLIPYWHAILYRVFGAHLYVLYSVSLAVTLAIVSLLFRIGREFVAPVYAFTAGVAFLLEAFERGVVFSYALPYSFPAIYSSLAMALMVYFGIRAIKSSGRQPVFWAAVTSAFSLLIKQEFGVFSLLLLIILLLARYGRSQSRRALARDALLCIPPMLAVAGVYLYSCSLSGLRLLLEENFMSAPQHYFTQHYGAVWAEVAGMQISVAHLLQVFKNSMKVGVFWTAWIFGMRWMVGRIASGFARWRNLIFGIICFVSIAAIEMKTVTPLDPAYAFPTSMYAFVLILFVMAGWQLKRNRLEPFSLARAFLIFAALVVGFRVCTNVSFYGYPIYYDPLLYLCALILLAGIIKRAMAGRSPFEQQAMHWGTVILLLGALAAASVPNYALRIPGSRMLVTEHGKLAIYSEQKNASYEKTLAFFEWAKANGRSVMVLPEDTALYFFAGISAPSRFYALTPGVIAPGAMTQSYLQDLARARVDYVVLTNRPFPEYGAPYFGIDFDRPVLEWIDLHYEVVGQIGRFGYHPFEIPWGALIYRQRGLAPLDVPGPVPGKF